jgi:hypothetical protein
VIGYHLLRVRVRNAMFRDLQAHADARTAECDRRIYISDIVRYAIRAYLVDEQRQDKFIQSIRDSSSGASVVAPENVELAV